MFEKLGKHWGESLHLKRECGASLNARELTTGKKVYKGENSLRVRAIGQAIGQAIGSRA